MICIVIIILILSVLIFFLLFYKSKYKLKGGVFTKEEEDFIKFKLSEVIATFNRIEFPPEPICIIADIKHKDVYTSLNCILFIDYYWRTGTKYGKFNFIEPNRIITNCHIQSLLPEYYLIKDKQDTWRDEVEFPVLKVYIEFMRRVIPYFNKKFFRKFSIIIDTWSVLFGSSCDDDEEFHMNNIFVKFAFCFTMLQPGGFIIILHPSKAICSVSRAGKPTMKDICCMYKVEVIKYFTHEGANPELAENGTEYGFNIYLRNDNDIAKLKNAHGPVLTENKIKEYYDKYDFYDVPVSDNITEEEKILNMEKHQRSDLNNGSALTDFFYKNFGGNCHQFMLKISEKKPGREQVQQ
jgi:hypothetical protein